MKNASILVKLCSAAFSIIFAGIIGLILLGATMNSTVNEMENIYYDELYSVNDFVLSADRDLYKAALANKQYVDDATKENPNADNIAAEKEAFSTSAGAAYSAVKSIEKVMVNYPGLGAYKYEGTDINSCIDEFEVNYMAWKALADPSKASTVDNYSKATASFSTVSDPLNMMGTIVKEYVAQETTSYMKSVSKNILVIVIIVAVIMIGTVVYTIFVIRYIRNNLAYVSTKISAIAQNDLTEDIKPLENTDELGALNKSAREVQNHLKSIIATLKGSSIALADSSREMDSSTVETADSIEHINSAASELASTATGQAADINDIAEPAEEITEKSAAESEANEE